LNLTTVDNSFEKKFFLINFQATFAEGATIKLENNQLTSFSEDIFKSILDGFISNSQSSNRITANQSKPILILFFHFNI